MGFLDRFRTVAQLPAGRFASLPEDNFVRVAGESHYQRALSSLRKKCIPGVEGRPSFPVALVPEPENQHDPHAIAVMSEAGRVGYLPRETAPSYARTMQALKDAGYDGGSCSGLLTGGARDRPNFGVVLTLAYPELCELHLGVGVASSGTGARRAVSGKTQAGELRGRHFTEYVDDVKALRRDGNDDAAERLLLELIDVNEAEARTQGWGVAPWYYEQLAVIYHKRKDSVGEVAILERYAGAPHAPGAGVNKLLERLEKARGLARRQRS
jgi:hypothetical protein